MKSFFSIFLFLATLQAQPTNNSAVPTPKQVLGYELGEKFSSHARIEKYITAVQQAASDRVKIIRYGETYEGRTLYLVVVSAPDNLKRLDEIRSNIRKLSDPRKITGTEAERIIQTSPAIAWLSYNVHGNEASSSEAALNVIYQLASRTDSENTSLLDRLVVVIDPLLNPDGHERYVNYETSRSGIKPVEDRNAVEHSEDWPSGRTNHYFIDLNRDWAWLTQQESRARIAAYREWKPQVHVDFHEMGYNSSYFFFPAFKPINKNFPKSTIEWGEIYGKANAAAFDKRGWSYWSGESFDLFYPGYGDSWPSLNGAIGMTYEQGGQTGLRVKRNDETILTLRDRLEHHSEASMATLKATADNKEKRLRDFYRFFVDAIAEGTSGPVKAYVIPPGNDPSRTAQMISLLKQQGVEISEAQQEFSADGLRTYFSPARLSKTFPAHSYIIPLDQPVKRLVMALMEQEPALSDTFFYDISSWALPVAYGVETYWTEKLLHVPSTIIDTVALPHGELTGGKAGYAYVMRWNSNDAVKALVVLLQNNYRVNVAMKEFLLNGTKFSRGAMIIPIASNPPDIHDRIKQLTADYDISIYAAQSGFTENGMNLGSDRAVRIRRPKIIIATNQPVGTESFGALWGLFDMTYGIDFVPMKLSQIRNTDLHDYTAMIFPDDYSGGQGYRGALDSGATQKIKTWIAGGGTFIGIEGGAAFASIAKIAGVKIKERDKSAKKDSSGKGEKLSDEELEKRMTVEERERKHRLESIPGTIVKVKLDPSHPLGFGYDTTITVFKTSDTMFELSDHGYNVGMYTKSPRLSGYMSKDNEKMLADTPFLVHEQLGSGNVILFADDPNFRMFWVGLNKIFLNSVLLMPSIRNVTLTAEGENN